MLVCSLQSVRPGGGAKGVLSCVCAAMLYHVTTSLDLVTACMVGLESSVTVVSRGDAWLWPTYRHALVCVYIM